MTDHVIEIDEDGNVSQPPILEFTLEEAQALNRILFREYISYTDPEAQAAVTKLYRWLQQQGVQL